MREADRERQKREWEMKEREAEEQRSRDEELRRRQQEDMTMRIRRQEEELHRRQQENNIFMQVRLFIYIYINTNDYILTADFLYSFLNFVKKYFSSSWRKLYFHHKKIETHVRTLKMMRNVQKIGLFRQSN